MVFRDKFLLIRIIIILLAHKTDNIIYDYKHNYNDGSFFYISYIFIIILLMRSGSRVIREKKLK